MLLAFSVIQWRSSYMGHALPVLAIQPVVTPSALIGVFQLRQSYTRMAPEKRQSCQTLGPDSQFCPIPI
jgi:hypothetical protein